MNIPNNSTPNVFKNFPSQCQNSEVIKPSENTNLSIKKKLNIPVIASTTAGTLLPILLIRKYQNKEITPNTLKDLTGIKKAKAVFNSFNLEYGLKEMILTASGSILGGFTGGLLTDKQNKKTKIKESFYQFTNIAVPTTIVSGLLGLTNKGSLSKKVWPKVISVLGGIGVGMPLAATISNEINSTFIDKDNTQKRKIKLKDCFVHVDDLLGTLVLAKVPLADKIHADKILPVLYGMCGYESGTKQ